MEPRPIARRAVQIEADWLTLGQAAKFLGVAQSTLRKWSDQGRVPAFYTPGGHRRFRRTDLDAFVGSSGPAHRSSGPVVLLVDGDPAHRELIRASLEGAGYPVRQADGFAAALAAIEDRAPQLVLLEVVTPGAEGWELLRRLEERHGAIPVIMYGQPFDPEELVGRAKQLLTA
jgi:excisionase family DNA binding protein